MNSTPVKHIGEIMQRQVVSVALEDSFDAVIATLHAHQLSCVPVVDRTGRCFGVLSARDLVQSYDFEAARLKAAWELCSYHAIEIAPHTALDVAAQMLLTHRVHHLIVKDGAKVVGIVSALDVLASLLGKPAGDEFGGATSVASTLGAGTSFSIRLPVAPKNTSTVARFTPLTAVP